MLIWVQVDKMVKKIVDLNSSSSNQQKNQHFCVHFNTKVSNKFSMYNGTLLFEIIRLQMPFRHSKTTFFKNFELTKVEESS